MSQPKRIFISYAHLDKEIFQEAKVRLSPLVRSGLVKQWTDEEIPVGSKWKEEIFAALGQAEIGLLLVTPNFLASEFITNHELEALIGKRVFWIHCRSSNFELTPLNDIQAAHDAGKPLNTLSEGDRDVAWTEIVKKLTKVVQNP